jgi:hypothetical protein
MIGEPTIAVHCDCCGEGDEIEMPYTYNDYSGKSGHYSEDAAFEKLEREGWRLHFGDGDETLCDECVMEREIDAETSSSVT